MQILLKKLYLVKFTLIYGVGFFVLGGFLLGLPAIICGLVVDWCFSRSKIRPKYKEDGTGVFYTDCTRYWFIYVVTVGLGYSYIVLGNYQNHGIIYDWVEFTKPFSQEMANYIAVIDTFPIKIGSIAGAWRESAMRHLYAVFWFTNIIFLPLAVSNPLGKEWTRKKIDWHTYVLNEIDQSKNKKIYITEFNLIRLIVILVGITCIYLTIKSVYDGDLEFSQSIHAKKYYILYPFNIGVMPMFVIMCLVNMYLVNKELIRRRFNG